MRHFRLTLVTCVLSWFMLGLHFQVAHEVTHHPISELWPVLVATLVLVVLGVTSLWLLLRAGPDAAHVNGN